MSFSLKMEEINVENLIEEVRIRPILWDWNFEEYKNTMNKAETWMELCSAICDGFEDKSDNDKRVILQDAKVKWRTVRDNFFRNLRKEVYTTPLGKKHRKYVYWNQLQFLVPNFQSRLTGQTAPRPSRKRSQQDLISEEVSDFDPNVDSIQNDISHSNLEQNVESTQYQNERFQIYDGEKIFEIPLMSRVESLSQSKKKKYPGEKTVEDDQIQQKNLQPEKILSEDEQFFNSLLSSVSELNDLQKLQFRIEVMQALVRVKQSVSKTSTKEDPSAIDLPLSLS